MKRGLATTVVLAFCTVTLGADVRVTTTTTIEGAVAAMMGGLVPFMVTHIKGSKARTDIVVGTQKISTIVDADAKQVTLLNATDMTARVVSVESMSVATGTMTMSRHRRPNRRRSSERMTAIPSARSMLADTARVAIHSDADTDCPNRGSRRRFVKLSRPTGSAGPPTRQSVSEYAIARRTGRDQKTTK